MSEQDILTEEEPTLGITSGYWVVRIYETKEILYCPVQAAVDFQVGNRVIASTKFGNDLGEIIGTSEEPRSACPESKEQESQLLEEIFPATDDDLSEYQQNCDKSAHAMSVTRALIDKHQLKMKLVKIHHVLKDRRIVFFFTSEKRVDFRGLVRDLVGHFRARIELRQIGVRDECRLTGGRGVCGRVLCCAAMGENLEPVSIKMAKIQKLSLNSQKISGPCGRLLCCLAFEYQTYQSEQRGLPREGQWIKDGTNRLRISEVNVLTRVVHAGNRDGLRHNYRADDLQFNRDANAYEPTKSEKLELAD